MPLRANASPTGQSGAERHEEVLYASDRTRVTRIWPSGGTHSVIVKQPLGAGSMARTRCETEVLERLAGLAGVVQLAKESFPGAIVLEDHAGRSLSEALRLDGPGRTGVSTAVNLGRQLAAVLAGMHRRGVVHKDLNPANILLVGAEGQPMLIDFDLASCFARDRSASSHKGQIVGTLAYLPPEQTGRTARAVDHRADLYALGAVLFELLAGRPPLSRDDVEDDDLQLVHDILVAVPAPLQELVPGVPAVLSAIVARLLEKEPDRRYQSAEGLSRDLARLAADPAASFPLGEWDFPLRLTAPSRLVGRDEQVAELQAALVASATGSRCVLVAGAPGVGKSALIDELRPAVAARNGWLVTGKSDQYRPDASSGAVIQAIAGLGRLLLAEPEHELALIRVSLRRALGANAGLVASVLPEFASLVGPATAVTTAVEADETQARLEQAIVALLRVVVSASRPVVLVLDDLQWADETTLGLLDALLTGDDVPGLLVLGAYRAQETGPEHPLTVLQSRWRRLGIPQSVLQLENLPGAELGELLGAMLRLPPARVVELAASIQEWTAGNPFDTVELINTLRRDEVLVLADTGWTWDAAAIGRYVGSGDVVDLIQQRIDVLPPETRALLQALACLGSDVTAALLAEATGLVAGTIRRLLTDPLEDGLLILDQDGSRSDDAAADGIRFRHDRVRQAAYAGLAEGDRSALHLALGRRLAQLPGTEVNAADQFLASAEPLEPVEGRQVAGLYQAAAVNARRTSNVAGAERFLAAAAQIWQSLGIGATDPVLTGFEIDWHAALHGLGRFGQADDVFGSLRRRCSDPVALAPAVCRQVSSLTQRSRHRDAISLGLALAVQLGQPPPDDAFAATIPDRLNELVAWAGQLDLAADLSRPEIADPAAAAAEKLFDRLLPTAFFVGEPRLVAWLVLASQRMWAEHGPSAGLAANLSCTGLVTAPSLGDYRIGYTVARHVLAVSEARGYEPETSVLRHRFSLHVQPWIEPLENSIVQAQAAREGLLRGGDLQMASHTSLTLLAAQLETGRSLETLGAEIDTAAGFAARTGNDHNAATLSGYRELSESLLTGVAANRVPEPATGDRAGDLEASPLAAGIQHICRSVTALLTGDTDALAVHSEQAMAQRRFVPGYLVTLAYLTRALSLTAELERTGSGDRAALLAELDGCRDWLAARATDAPGNFRHLLLLVVAERARVLGEFEEAFAAYDAAAHAASSCERPWHQALIAERAGRFALSRDLQHAGHEALTQARQYFAAWGAAGLVAGLDQTFPFLRTTARPLDTGGTRTARPTSSVNADTLDMVAILRACQALSSQTRLDQLQAVIVEQLSTLTGATEVLLALRDDETQEWFLPRSGNGPETLPVELAGARGLMPLTAFRYAERTGEPLLVENATLDERFARDSYLHGLTSCSLLLAPIISQGSTRAMLILSNQRSSGAFTQDRLDAVRLITGQLTVSLGNAQLYGSLEQRVAERTGALAAANRKLETLTMTDPLTALGNRRRFEQVLAEEWDRAQLGGQPLGVVMIDVDWFKRYNDHYGHQAGDECLRKVAARLSGSTRGRSDLVCRYGGEEFVIVVPAADGSGSLVVGERARAAVADLALPHAGGVHGTVTVSIGVASAVPVPADNSDQLVARADAALYEAKSKGRNQVCAAADPGAGQQV